MPAHLTSSDIKKIVQIINNWNEPKLTWALLIEALKNKLHIKRTRQSLNDNQTIRRAFQDRKEAMKNSSSKSGWINDIDKANQKIEELTLVIERLQNVNGLLLERFVIWQANASMQGVSEAKLDQPVSTLK